MADRRHAITQLDFFIRQVTLFADEIRNAVGQKLDVLGFKTTGRDLGEQMAFGFLLEFLQKVVVILCDRFACHRIQRLAKILRWCIQIRNEAPPRECRRRLFTGRRSSRQMTTI